jgi:serine/threonine-protein kinase
MLTGEAVFDCASDLDKLWAHVHEPPPLLRSVKPELPGELEEVLARVLSKSPDERQRTAAEFAREVIAAVGV